VFYQYQTATEYDTCAEILVHTEFCAGRDKRGTVPTTSRFFSLSI